MSSDSEEVLKLFDFYWFEHEILGKNQPIISSPGLDLDEEVEPKLKLYSTPSFLVRSFSDQNLSSKDSLFLATADQSPSPKSVLLTSKLQTILSGKEVGEFDSEPAKVKEGFEEGKMRRKKGRRSSDSKSLSELEFEELKGFMDLGFVFSDEDKASSLVSIIPGLQRFGRKVGVDQEEKKDFLVDKSTVSRPYLSEAWDVLEEKKAEKKMKNPLMNWRINPALGTEIEIKDQLRFWAHTVASTVK